MQSVSGGLGSWSWPFVTFRVADGATAVLFPLAAILRYDLSVAGVAGVVAVLNLGSVPATLAWCRIMERNPARRRITIAGLLVSAAAMATLALPLPFPAYLAAAVVAVAFGVAIAPAAGILVLEGRPRQEWPDATGRLSRRSALAYMVGLGCTLALGLSGNLEPSWIFMGAAIVAAVAAFTAARTITPRRDLPTPAPTPEPRGSEAMIRQAGRLERLIFFPMRLRFRPSLASLRTSGPAAAMLLGVVTMFGGTVVFFSGYQGILINVVGLSAGLVVLAETGSHLANSLAFRWAGAYGSRRGEPRAIAIGYVLRLAAMALLIGAVLWRPDYVLYLLLGAGVLLGISFALLQVNIPCLLAAHHPGGSSTGVGSYHTAVAVGVLCGSVTGYLLMRFVPLPVAYGAAWVLLALGGGIVLRSSLRIRHGSAPG